MRESTAFCCPAGSGRSRWPRGLRALALGLAALCLTASLRPSPGRRPAYRFAPGEQIVYRLDYRNTSNADLRPLFGSVERGEQPPKTSSLVQHVAADLEGDFTCTAVVPGVAGTTNVVAYCFQHPAVHIQVNGQDMSGQAAVIQGDLGREMFATVDRRGRILSVRFDPEVSVAARDFARAVLGVVQFVLPGEAKSDWHAWESKEDDPSGSYIAHYELVTRTKRGSEDHASALCLPFRKKKVRYSPPATRAAHDEVRPLRTTKPSTEVFGCIDADNGRLSFLRGKDILTTLMGGHSVVHSETAISLVFDRQRMLSESELKGLRDRSDAYAHVAAIALSRQPSEAEVKTAIRRNTLGEDTLNSLIADLTRQESADGKETTSLYLRFRALAYLQPETCKPLGQKLANADARGVTFRVLVDALSAVGSREAQAALVAVIESRPQDWPALALVIPALGLVTEPIPEAEQAVRRLAFESSDPKIASTSQLALGNMARRLMVAFPGRAAGILDLLLSRTESGPFRSDPGQLLMVLGNAGSGRALPFITRFASDSSAEIRATAVSALRFIEGSRAEQLLVHRLVSDHDSSVRRAAAQAFSFREITKVAFQAQKSSLLRDTNKEVRLAVLSNLSKARRVFPEIPALIAGVARKDPAPEVRQAAAFLASRATD